MSHPTGAAWRPIVLLAALALASACSTAPKDSGTVYEKRDQAVKYGAQADRQFALGNYSDALSFYRKALETNVSIDNDAGIIVSRNAIGRTYAAAGLAGDAKAEFEKALGLAERAGLDALRAQALCGLAELELSGNGTDAALALLDRARALAGKDEGAMAVVLHDYGIARKQQGDYPEAASFLEKALAINQRLKRLSESASNCYMLSSVSLKRGDAAKARVYALKALEIDKQTENSLSIATDYFALGKISLAEGKDEEAYACFEKAFSVELVQNMARESLKSLDELVPLAEKLGKAEDAAEYRSLRESIAAVSEAESEKAAKAAR
jgi:tetratricopeptide (TPR) repeat protein